MMHISFNISSGHYKIDASQNSIFDELFELMANLIETNDPHYHFSICWCIAWAGDANIFPEIHRVFFINHLMKSWINLNNEYNIQRVTSWALSKILNPFHFEENNPEIERLKIATNARYKNPSNEFDQIIAVCFKINLGQELNKNDVEKIFSEHTKRKRKRDKQGYSSRLYLFLEKLDIEFRDKSEAAEDNPLI
ncbi:hypothetical protein [Candidatus Thiothrix anitrata]|uniref:DNA alkylation repair protein n=1 Tax=Candidatus Thiothrix anitrata TaxID=2823902 RepID=A0ABX7X7Q8_9GAMM|nr:hypothetical protein [Candidatus Thiothrix anitrata]QTR51183.1 hypothetical protein J8380_06430 [Candidatus Thiothrix anitrata]